MLLLRVSFTALQFLRLSCLLDIRKIVWRALCRQFLRLQRPPLRPCLAVPTSVQASGTPPSASISPEFLASVIQAIQSLISAIVQQSLSAVVSAHSVSQDLPTIAAQGSSLATCAAHWMHVAFINLGLHQVLLGFCCRLLRPVLQYQWLHHQCANRYVVLTYRAVFLSCFFLCFLVFYSTLFFGGLQPSDCN